MPDDERFEFELWGWVTAPSKREAKDLLLGRISAHGLDIEGRVFTEGITISEDEG